MSGDGDLAGPLRALRQRYATKQVLLAFPPQRSSKALRKEATAFKSIGRDALRDSQLPQQITKADGFVLERPSSWV